MATSRGKFRTFLAMGGGLLFIVSGLRHFAWMLYWWGHHNPPFAIWRGFRLGISLLGALVLFAYALDQLDEVDDVDQSPSRLRRIRERFSDVVDATPAAIALAVGGMLFVVGVVGLLESDPSLDSVAFALTGCGGFYILKRALAVREI